MSLITVRDLKVNFGTPDGVVEAVRGIDFDLEAGKTLGIVGESGSGKSQTVLSLMGLLADNGRSVGSARFEGRELIGMADRDLRSIRGNRIAMIFQDPMTSLNPYLKIGVQMAQVLELHEGMSRRQALGRCRELLEAVRIPDAGSRLQSWPHELSGGMRQRVTIATALLCTPSLLIADEPTTALDVTVQAQILTLMQELRSDFNAAIIFITHDLGIVAGFCDDVLVMQNGECKERGSVDEVYARPEHPYTQRLLAAVPRLDRDARPRVVEQQSAGPALDVEGLDVVYSLKRPRMFASVPKLQAVTSGTFAISPGETLGVVGESGCGKSSLARAVIGLVPASAGRVTLLGRDLQDANKKVWKAARRNMQMIFQDPLASLNPRMTARQIVAEPLGACRPDLSRAERDRRVVRILNRVGLKDGQLDRYPHEFSGGQCQRIGIARALAPGPAVVICDEAVSALDVSIRAQIVDLLMELQEEFGLALMFIAHDLAVVRQISHRVVVMYLGRAMEIAHSEHLYGRPMHPYTRALIEAAPIPDPAVERARKRELLEGEPPSPLNPPPGCAFSARCSYAVERCRQEIPALRNLSNGLVACHRAEEISAGRA